MTEGQHSTSSAWRERLAALRNVPPVLGILWESGRAVVTWGILLRIAVAALPAGIAVVAAWILNGVQTSFSGKGLPQYFWWAVVGEVCLNVISGLLMRGIDYSDSLLADRYTHFVSVRVMRQAAQLDLTTYEDPVFYDRLERARVQATDRLAMIQQMGRLLQQSITTVIWTSLLLWYSPWLVLLLGLGVLPTFLGETHFAFLGYAKNFRQTPAKRQMDYLRQTAGSREGAKELKLFNLSEFFTSRFTAFSKQIYDENVALSRRKLIAGGLLGVIATLGYYGAYVFVIC
jgi:ATP-binding cassette subfamily B protein